MIFSGKVNQTGTALELEDRFKEWALKHKGVRIVIEPFVPESRKQRKFYHGAVIPLWVYLDGRDYKDPEKLDQYHEVAKREFNGEVIKIGKKVERVGKSTKGVLNKGFLEKVIDYLIESYAIDPSKILNPEEYKRFRDMIYMDGAFEDYIDYLKAKSYLK